MTRADQIIAEFEQRDSDRQISQGKAQPMPDHEAQRLSDLARFYHALDELADRTGNIRTLAACDGRMEWPERGVYFFFEASEMRTGSGSGPRVVRVGTHALKAGSRTKLRTRLLQHRGTTRQPGGSHRSSVFRLMVGNALLISDPKLQVPTWEERNNPSRLLRNAERSLEVLVSRHIGAMPVLWLRVDDQPGCHSMRSYVERNAIALLSAYGTLMIDPPSNNWLGAFCSRERVQRSGLWNNNHVDEKYDPRFLSVFDDLVGAA